MSSLPRSVLRGARPTSAHRARTRAPFKGSCGARDEGSAQRAARAARASSCGCSVGGTGAARLRVPALPAAARQPLPVRCRDLQARSDGKGCVAAPEATQASRRAKAKRLPPPPRPQLQWPPPRATARRAWRARITRRRCAGRGAAGVRLRAAEERTARKLALLGPSGIRLFHPSSLAPPR